MKTCTWAPSTFAGTQVVKTGATPRAMPSGAQLREIVKNVVGRIEALGLSHLLIAQRWWGNAQEIEGSTLDCLAMTDFIAAHTERVRLVTAIHPGFFQPTAIAKWAATLDNLTDGRWSINVTSGWNMQEFDMYGIDQLTHDERYLRSSEFIDVLKGAWNNDEFSFRGDYYQADRLVMEPRPVGELEIFQGGQSEAAIRMACRQSDWMFLNGGTLDKIKGVIEHVRKIGEEEGRCPRFAVYAIPVVRTSDEEADAVINDMISKIDPAMIEERKKRVSGAEGMWAETDLVTMLDTNEGYATGLIGSPDTVMRKVEAFHAAGVDMFHLALGDALFESEVLPAMIDL